MDSSSAVELNEMNSKVPGLNERLQRILLKLNILDWKKIMQMSVDDLKRIYAFSNDDIHHIMTAASGRVINHTKHYVHEEQFLSCGCEVIDKVLGGGIRNSGITEITGESGCGKTQLCLQLCVNVQNEKQHGGFNKGAIYVCTGSKFPSNRLTQLVSSNNTFIKASLKDQYCDNILVDHIADIDGFNECLSGRLKLAVANNDIGLLIVDSITALFRCHSCFDEMKTRTKQLRQIAQQLHNISVTYGMCIVCINQVSSAINKTDDNGMQGVVPSLGLVWSNLITTRIALSRNAVNINVNNVNKARTLKLLFSPHTPPAQCSFNILPNGIKGV